jgi:translocation protein SEC66
VQSQLEAEKTWWEGRRAGIQSEFMKELESDEKPPDTIPQRKNGSDDDAVLVEAGGPAGAQGGKKKKAKK